MPSPSAVALAAKGQGNVEFKKENYQLAIRHYLDAIKESPDYIDALSNLGLCYKKLNKKDLAIATFQKVLVLQPQHQKALSNLLDILKGIDLTAKPELA